MTFEFQPALAEKGLDLVLDLAPDVILFCDPDKLERVFDNMLRNAMNYSDRDAPIAVTLSRGAQEVVITVENQGPDIPPEKLARIFEQFFRLDASRSSASGGAGLGLSIAKEIVERHNVTIRAESKAHRISFSVTLPLPGGPAG